MLDCATIRDLLPLYVDDVVSKESRALISGHLATCESCKEEFIKMQSGMEAVRVNIDDAEIGALRDMKNKIYRDNVIIAIISALVVFSVILIIIIGAAMKNLGSEAVGFNWPLLIGVTAGGIFVNTIFGLYNLRITKRIKELTKAQTIIVLLLNIINTTHGFVHLLVNMILGAYKK